MTEEKSIRIEYLDTAKTFLIFLVILGHVLIILNPAYSKIHFTVIQSFIYCFHMPAFFIIHGILFNTDKWRRLSTLEFIKTRVKTLIIPYLFFEIVGIIWKYFFQKQHIFTGIYNMITVRCNVGADWFLPALLLGSLLYLINKKCHNKLLEDISLIASFLLPMFIPRSQFMIVIGRGLLAYGFITIGHKGKMIFQSVKIKKTICMAITFLITGICAIISLKWTGNDFYTCTINNPLILALGGSCGTCFILGMSQLLQSRIFSRIGCHSLTIMGTHQLIIYAFTSMIPTIKNGSIAWGILLIVVIVVSEIPIVYVIDKYLFFFVGRAKTS